MTGETHMEDTTAAVAAEPTSEECLLCFVTRMLDTAGCDNTLRWAMRWRDARAPRATGLARRLERQGGYCDCEILMNGWDLVEDLQHRDGSGNLRWPGELPGCAGGRSSQPCAHWAPRQRGRW
jgi:hypothetical protein